MHPALANLTPPSGWFGSDNQAGAHPKVLQAMVDANVGSAVGYGDDPLTERAVDAFKNLFGGASAVLFTFNGTGANVASLATLLPRWGGVLSAAGAHIDVDEGGGPEAFLGAKLATVPTADGKLLPEHIDAAMDGAFDQHHVWPRVVSITQSTELGTLYSVDEVAAICDKAHAHGMFVHMDGARVANATAALDVPVRALSFDVGVDVLSFGGTKNGMVMGEAVVVRRPEHALAAKMIRKQTSQLASKMRFLSAQFLAMLEGDLWLQNARHANAMAALLHHEVADVPGLRFERETVVNSMFPIVPAAIIEPLQDWAPHYTWNPVINQVRWVTSFATSEDDIRRFAAGVRALCASTTA